MPCKGNVRLRNPLSKEAEKFEDFANFLQIFGEKPENSRGNLFNFLNNLLDLSCSMVSRTQPYSRPYCETQSSA